MHAIQSLKAVLLISGTYNAVASSPKTLNDHLLAKATPLKGYNRDLGYFNFRSWNKPSQNTGTTRSRYYQSSSSYDDDFYNLDHQFQFKGYSLHYAKCAKVQRFSPDAVQQGEYSSMVTDNIVILRLCPKGSCISSSKYGCSNGYGEYAIDLNDYMTAIVKYENEKEQRFCEFCDNCNFGSSNAVASSTAQSYSYADDDTSSNGQRNLGSSYFTSTDGTIRLFDKHTCYAYSNKCKNQCASYYSSSGQYKNYMNYIGCQKVSAQDGKDYWVSPTCNTSYNQVSLGVYYDNLCEVDASDSISVDYLLSDSYDSSSFGSMAKITCTDCSENVYPPFYNSNNLLCNNVYQNSGQCDNMINIGSQYYTDDGISTTSTSQAAMQCAFIDSVINGSYDMNGQIYLSSFRSSIDAAVTVDQKITLVILTLLSAGLAFFSCFIHHKMTNLLLKSLKSGLAGSKKRWIRGSHSRFDDESTNGSIGSSTHASRF